MRRQDMVVPVLLHADYFGSTNWSVCKEAGL
jgi:hypothetical protein